MKNKNIIDSFNNAINGIIYTIKAERNMKIHIAAASLVLLLSLFFKLSFIEFLVVCVVIALVIVAELINTAVEVMVDIIVDVYHPKAKIVKDVAAGAVLVSTFVAMLVGYFVFFERLCIAFEAGFKIVKQAPISITVIALVITVILTLVMKAGFKRGTPFQGGMPSGHTALGFCAATAISLWSSDAKIAVLGYSLAILVMQSRLEGRIHSFMETFIGALLGFLCTLLLFQVFYL